MRDAIGSTWVYMIVIVFTLIFAGFLVLVMSYSKAYKIKNEMTSIIEKYEGLTVKASTSEGKSDWGSIKIINSYLKNSGYNTKGGCYNDNSYNRVLGATDLEADSLEDITHNPQNKSNDYYYCIKIKYNKDTDKALFTINVFYDFTLPIFGRIAKYNISGQTHEIQNALVNGKRLKS